ncbi:ATP-binding protein [Paragemmobacter straminiformis]|uniref:ATP-binding protein n=1 Tax=Paragemmobacter straminiformis TaxID=2045119 RepID=A0A842IDM9_9RHOB|nr:ATP-binding protein [Gemmobacter straminiformis]MBC2837576.1 ATP-binding protein [Gemmobacter straminiformis]
MHHEHAMLRALTEVSPAAQAVTALMVGWDEDARDAVDLTLVEALTNIVRHGPPHETRPIRLEIDLTDASISIDIVDFTSPMPPDLLERAGTATFEFDADDVQAIPESGRGLALIMVLMDEVTLHEQDELSRLRLVRRR